MNEEAPDPQNMQPSSGRLPALTAKRHGTSPFRPLAPSIAEPQQLGDQVRVDPAVTSPALNSEAISAVSEIPSRQGKRKRQRRQSATNESRQTQPAQETELVRLQTLVPFETQVAFKLHCVRSRTTINDELRRLIERFLLQQP